MASYSQYQGLSDAQVLLSREKNGRNVLSPPVKTSRWKLFLEKFSDPLIAILLVIGIFAIGVSCYEYFALHEGGNVFFEPIGIFVAILLATGLSFYFELKAQKEFSILNKENDHERVSVVRNGNVQEIEKCDVVVGDILILRTGDEIPADGHILESTSLIVDESSLTGEPAHPKGLELGHGGGETTYPADFLYRGTQIVEGHAIAEVTAVGDSTENGRIMLSLLGLEVQDDAASADENLSETQQRALRLQERTKISRKVRTPLDEQLDKLGRLISNLSFSIAGMIIVARLLVYFDWAWLAWTILLPTALLVWLVIKRFPRYSRIRCLSIVVSLFAVFIVMVLWLHDELMPTVETSHLLAYALTTVMIAVTLVVVAVPEGLPMAVSLSLANSMRRMLKTGNLVRKMHACETMGAATVICTDKTGTLTANQMQVRETLLQDDELLWEGIAVNSTAALDFSEATPHVVGNPTEGALLLWLYGKGLDYRQMRRRARVTTELPFSTELKFMATEVVSGIGTGKRMLYVKGAPEIVMSMCGDVFGCRRKDEVTRALANMQSRAMRTLAFAYKELSEDEHAISEGRVVAEGLTLAGVVGIEDPVRGDVPEAVRKCLGAGIQVKIVTGDTMPTAREIARQIGIWTDKHDTRNIIDGRDFEALSDEELLSRVDDLIVIARARPMDKKRLVEALQRKGEVVAVTGDGTNDAPALNAAHVGLSMGSGTSVAKEASDITIIDNSFASIARAVMWGRSLYQNIQRFLLFQLTVNVAACLLVLFGSFMGTESPLTVTQMLWVNLIMDTFAAFALSALPPTERVMHDAPRNRKDFILNKNMRQNIFGVGIFFFVLLLVLLYIFQHSDVTQVTDLFHLSLGAKGHVSPYELTLLFTIFVMTHFWYLFNTRGYASGGSGLDLRGCDGFEIIAVTIFLGQIAIVQVPVLNTFFNSVPLSLSDWLIITSLSSLVMIVREVRALLRRM